LLNCYTSAHAHLVTQISDRCPNFSFHLMSSTSDVFVLMIWSFCLRLAQTACIPAGTPEQAVVHHSKHTCAPPHMSLVTQHQLHGQLAWGTPPICRPTCCSRPCSRRQQPRHQETAAARRDLLTGTTLLLLAGVPVAAEARGPAPSPQLIKAFQAAMDAQGDTEVSGEWGCPALWTRQAYAAALCDLQEGLDILA
jgi:hypothetical protein